MGGQQTVPKDMGLGRDWLNLIGHGDKPALFIRRHPELPMVSFSPRESHCTSKILWGAIEVAYILSYFKFRIKCVKVFGKYSIIMISSMRGYMKNI